MTTLPALIEHANVRGDPDSVAELRARIQAGKLIDLSLAVIGGRYYLDKTQAALLQKLLDKVVPNATPEPAGLPARSVEDALKQAALRGDTQAQKAWLTQKEGWATEQTQAVRPYVVVIPAPVKDTQEWLSRARAEGVLGDGTGG